MGARPRVFVTRRLPGGALERLALRAEMTVWEGDGAPPPEAIAAGARDAEGLLCLLTDRIDAALLRGLPAPAGRSRAARWASTTSTWRRRPRAGSPSGTPPACWSRRPPTWPSGCCSRRPAGSRRRTAICARGAGASRTAGTRRPCSGAICTAPRSGSSDSARSGAPWRGARPASACASSAGRARRAALPGVEACSLERLLAEAEFVSVHVALTPETRGLLGAARSPRCARAPILVNAARGGIVDEAALAAALASGRLAAAALDVFAQEPLDPASPLLAAPNLVLTPHIGSASIATRTRMADLAVENLLAGLEGRPLLHQRRLNRAQPWQRERNVRGETTCAPRWRARSATARSAVTTARQAGAWLARTSASSQSSADGAKIRRTRPRRRLAGRLGAAAVEHDPDLAPRHRRSAPPARPAARGAARSTTARGRGRAARRRAAR